ncbi:MAG: glycosyl hydrolase family 98 [Bacteroidaceae bacterium]|nr:glycosyl hydrolase family 98 [Bacteroidaceae bacterium]
MKARRLLLYLSFVICSHLFVVAQQRRPIDNEHPMWMIHIDVWNSADPQKIIDQIPEDIRPYVCMNLSFSCQFDTNTSMYRMPRNAVRTWKSWASVCQQNGMWFSCQPASGGHTHIQDNDLETFEYFFKTYPNFLGWNYAEQFWAFGDAGDKSSMTAASRWALFANLVEMSHKYGGFLTVSWCGGVYHMNTNPIAELKLDANFLAACKKYPEAILFLYKYTHCSSFYNNESVCWGPFISGLTKNYGVRYDNCGWNDMTSKLVGEHKCSYPGSAGIGTVMEQCCVNGGAVWDGPELIWSGECFQNLSDSQEDGYTCRNWGTFPNFKGIWLDMWRRIIDGTMYIPSREEVVAKTKIVVINDKADDYTSWDDLYNGLYLQTDPGNQRKESGWNYGQWQNNLCYFKSTGRYGAIPIVTGLYDNIATAIPVQVKKTNYTSRWSTQAKKQADFNAQYPEVSTGDLYVNRYRNQLVTYTPYTYLGGKESASANIPLRYNTCDTLKLKYGKLSGGVIREYADHIDFYLNNYRNDTITLQTDEIIITGVTAEPTASVQVPSTEAPEHSASISAQSYSSETQTFAVSIKHLGPAILRVDCSGGATGRLTEVLPAEALEIPKQPEPYHGSIVIEAENMDRKSADCKLTHSGWWAQDYFDFAGMGFVETQASTSCALRHQLQLSESGNYQIIIRYCNSSKAGRMKATINGKSQAVTFEKVAKNDWHEAVINVTLKEGKNVFVLQNSSSIKMTIDQIIYEPEGCPKEKYKVTVRDSEFGQVMADVDSVAAGETVNLTIMPEEGYALKALRVVNSVFFTQEKTILFDENATEVSFIMPDDNVTIQPVFYDLAANYELDYMDVVSGALPVGWRTTDGSDVRNYPSQNGSGPRTFVGLTGYQGKALYWRNTSAEYGRLSEYLLTLEPGKYSLIFAMAAWKGTPVYQARILNASGSVVKSSTQLRAQPNVDGNSAGDISGAVRNTLNFEVKKAGNYIIQFLDKTSAGGMHEFLLAECRVRSHNILTDIANLTLDESRSNSLRNRMEIYTLGGQRITNSQLLKKGIYIVNGKKVVVR